MPGDFDDPINRSRRDLERVSTFLSSIVENIPAMIFVKNAETLRFELFNRAGEELLGMPREEMIGKGDTDFFPPDQSLQRGLKVGSAGCGTDAQPYFRVFNPTLQGEKFDPNGDYVRRYVPELARLPAKLIHRPAQAPINVLEIAGIDLGVTYPEPIVDHAMARDRFLKIAESHLEGRGARGEGR